MSGSGDDVASFLYLLLLLVMLASALMVHRVPLGAGLKMALAWVLIFLVVFVGFTLKDDFLALGRRVLNDTRNGGQIAAAGGELRIRKSADGHFWVNAEINGHDIRFLVDSGATTTSISSATATRSEVVLAGGLPTAVGTANGIVTAQRGRIARLAVGTIERREVAVLVAEAFGDVDVLGMNFLSSLSSWGVEGEWLVLRP